MSYSVKDSLEILEVNNTRERNQTANIITNLSTLETERQDQYQQDRYRQEKEKAGRRLEFAYLGRNLLRHLRNRERHRIPEGHLQVVRPHRRALRLLHVFLRQRMFPGQERPSRQRAKLDRCRTDLWTGRCCPI